MLGKILRTKQEWRVCLKFWNWQQWLSAGATVDLYKYWKSRRHTVPAHNVSHYVRTKHGKNWDFFDNRSTAEKTWLLENKLAFRRFPKQILDSHIDCFYSFKWRTFCIAYLKRKAWDLSFLSASMLTMEQEDSRFESKHVYPKFIPLGLCNINFSLTQQKRFENTTQIWKRIFIGKKTHFLEWSPVEHRIYFLWH